MAFAPEFDFLRIYCPSDLVVASLAFGEGSSRYIGACQDWLLKFEYGKWFFFCVCVCVTVRHEGMACSALSCWSPGVMSLIVMIM